MPAPASSPNFLLRQLWLAKRRQSQVYQSLNSAPAQDVGQSNQGLTIMECLVAIMLIGLTIAMVTPPLLIATASRVQTRRAEQATQLAQDEIDRINTMVQQGVHQARFLPTVAAGDNLSTQVSAPATLANFVKTSRSGGCPGTIAYNSQTLGLNQALPIDVDGDCTVDFFMQVFRTAGTLTLAEAQKTTANTRRPARFTLGVRVYSALARVNLGSGKLQTTPASLQDKVSRLLTPWPSSINQLPGAKNLTCFVTLCHQKIGSRLLLVQPLINFVIHFSAHRLAPPSNQRHQSIPYG
jgi:type II secretory pathway pseudopilin PulG